MIYSVAMQRRDCGFKEQLVLGLFAGVALEDEVGWFTGGDKFSAELGTKGFKLCFLVPHKASLCTTSLGILHVSALVSMYFSPSIAQCFPNPPPEASAEK